MASENQIFERFAAELAQIAALDRRYYSNSYPTALDRAAYAARQDQLEYTRSRFYAELRALRLNSSAVVDQ